MVVIESAGSTDKGQKREKNEDDMLLDDNLNLFMIADGMGGHKAGEIASSMVVDTVHRHMGKFNDEMEVNSQPAVAGVLSKEAEKLISCINMANSAVYQYAISNQSCSGMGSTVSAIFFTDHTFIAANVGDTPIYLVQNNNIELISVTHTVLAEQKALNPEADKTIEPGFGHMLTRAMGNKETVETDSCEIQCLKNDILVISSDGLSDKVSQDEIYDVVTKKTPGKACQILTDMANQRGGDDNITVIVVKVKKINHSQNGIFKRIYHGTFSSFNRLFSKYLKKT